MRVASRLFVALLMAASAAPAFAAAEATLFRIFLKDGSAVVSYGEFARVEDRVVFSMPVGGRADEPRLQVVWIPAASVDWPRTDRYAESARFQQYAQTRGEEDFQQLNNDVARVLNDVALSTDRASALVLAERARSTLADWPREHHGYRQDDVREIMALIDEAIAGLRASGGATNFDLALVAPMPTPALEPLLGMPTANEQLDSVLHLTSLTDSSAERVSLLQSALTLLEESPAAFSATEATALRGSIEARIREDLAVDRRYTELARQLTQQANRAAAQASVSSVERVLNRIGREDARLGGQRPEMVAALRASVRASLRDARRLRLLRDQWALRQSIYRDYQRLVGSQLLSLVRAQPSLEAIRQLDGPALSVLKSLDSRLSGGAERLERLDVPADMRSTHGLLISAWRFAENAARGRLDAVASGSVSRAWEASSAAAGALMLLSRAQQDIRDLLELPHLQ